MKIQRKHIKNILSILIPVILISLPVWFFMIREKNNSIFVRKVEVKNRIVIRSVTAVGIVSAKKQADLSFPTVGKISYLGIEKGDMVKKGQLLAYQDTSSQYQNVVYYKDALDIKIRQRDLFADDYKGNKDLYGGDKRFNIKLREYDEGITQAEAAYKAQQAILNNMYIYSPIDGIVTEITKELGETASLGEIVIKVSDLNHLVFKINVDQEDYGLIKEGQDVDIELESYPGKKIKGKVLALPYFANDVTQQFEIEIEIIPGEGTDIKLGMKGDAYIILETSTTEVPSITIDEVSYDESDNPYVWILDGIKIKQYPIEIGVDGDVFVQIKNDVPNEVLVPAKENDEMIEGYKAKIIN